MLALAKIASLTVLAVQVMLNGNNIHPTRSLFVLTRAFTPDLPGLLVSAIVMVPDIGARIGDASTSLATKDAKRRQQDCDQREHQTAMASCPIGKTYWFFHN
jgi:hypothetical protein